MTQTILITGSTDGIGRLTAEKLVAEGHHVLLHGRDASKVQAVAAEIDGQVSTFIADFSDLDAVAKLADDILSSVGQLDVLINNAGVLKAPSPMRDDGHDIRFVVNTYAPYLLACKLLPIIPESGRVVNLSSAAQARVNLQAMRGGVKQSDIDAYAQSKLAITIWTRDLAKAHAKGPVFVAVNPGSLLASKMVKQGFGIDGKDLSIGANILVEAALGERFANASGAYFDNDAGSFANLNAAALDQRHAHEVMETMRDVMDGLGH